MAVDQPAGEQGQGPADGDREHDVDREGGGDTQPHANGRNRVPSTSEANRLLSGSSARKMTANVVRMVSLTREHSDAHPGGAT